MSDEPFRYQRLPGAGSSVLQRVHLWLGPDHLLHVSSMPFGERYKRFYFADIQSFTIHRSSKWSGVAILLLVMIGLFIVPAVTSEDGGARWIFASLAACFVVMLVTHLAFGPTCSVTIRTAVQTERLPSLGRLRIARRVLARVRPLITAAQTTRPAENAAS